MSILYIVIFMEVSKIPNVVEWPHQVYCCENLRLLHIYISHDLIVFMHVIDLALL